MPTLDALDVNSFLQVLSYLDACTLGRMACSSLLLAVAAEEAQRRPALLVLKGSPAEVAQEMRTRLASRPTLVCLNYTEKENRDDRGEDILAFMQKILPKDTTVLAAQTNSLLCVPETNTLEEPRTHEDIGVLLATLPGATSKAFHFSSRTLASDPRYDSDEEDDYSSEEDDEAGSAPAAGAATAQADSAKKGGDWLASLSAGPPCETPETSAGTAAKSPEEADYEELFTLDPPPQVIIMHLAGNRGESLIKRLQDRYPEAAIIGGVAMGQEVVVRDRAKDGRERASYGGGVGIMAICGNAPVYAMTSPLNGSQKAAQQLLCSSLQAAVAYAGKEERRILGALLFTCNARQTFGDANQFLQQVPKAQLLGCYAGGEIGPRATKDLFVRGSACAQGFTAVFGVFLVPDKQAPSVHFQRAMLQGQVREAYNALRPRERGACGVSS
mmetsp:Transcript_19270/g.34897  ORF Transcript_19270/g.34897 Transcript_19270/m.34897 type:complete len:443 (+) Transcript_19270:56-1384(+)